jgi:hypothetical protein
MKRIFGVLLFCLAGTLPLSAEFRIETGMDLLFAQNPGPNRDTTVLLDGAFVPLPEVGLYGQFNFEDLHLGAGLRGFSFFLLYTVLWPSLYGEYDLGNISFQAQLGGGLFAVLDLLGGGGIVVEDPAYPAETAPESAEASTFTLRAHPTVIPEISIWFRFGRFSRIGGGWVTQFILLPDQGKIFTINPQFYVAYKMSFPSAKARSNPDGTQRLF